MQNILSVARISLIVMGVLFSMQNHAYSSGSAYGYVDGVILSGNQYQVKGWACIPPQTGSINVALYAGLPSSNHLIGTYLANIP